jgi:hypothetical protein
MTLQSALRAGGSPKGRLVTAILGALLGALGAHAAGPEATVKYLSGCPCDGVVMAPPVPCPVCACPLAGDTTGTHE